ncbi:DUF4240 domain-containing protein [Streptomyces sp. NPDC047841]|uniref:DUF4240 domain-containing protein n=1 Tax=Streptomyces sp. NPDC047841 TaxID=3154708 RepID=UPI003455866C
MNEQRFWQLIAAARAQARDPDDAGEVAGRATALLATRPAEEIVAAQQVLWDLMAGSYTTPLWAAAYVINGGCSDDGFDYFRGWLIAQGREVFDRVVADPDALAEVPVVRASAADGIDLDCEEALGIAWNAHLVATGTRLPGDAFTIRYPEPDPAWDFDFGDRGEMTRRLPRLAALCLDQAAQHDHAQDTRGTRT